jgi:hypothetical protein
MHQETFGELRSLQTPENQSLINTAGLASVAKMRNAFRKKQ